MTGVDSEGDPDFFERVPSREGVTETPCDDDVIGACCALTRVPRKRLLSPSRQGEVCDARKLMAWAMRHYQRYTHAEIGRRIGRDKSTVSYMLRGYDPGPWEALLDKKLLGTT